METRREGGEGRVFGCVSRGGGGLVEETVDLGGGGKDGDLDVGAGEWGNV